MPSLLRRLLAAAAAAAASALLPENDHGVHQLQGRYQKQQQARLRMKAAAARESAPPSSLGATQRAAAAFIGGHAAAHNATRHHPNKHPYHEWQPGQNLAPPQGKRRPEPPPPLVVEDATTAAWWPGPEYAPPAKSPQRRNIVLMVCDDLQADNLGVYRRLGPPGYGSSSQLGVQDLMDTSHLDDLAQGGAVLTRHMTAAPVCSPARYSILTGRHPSRNHAARAAAAAPHRRKVDKYRCVLLRATTPVASLLRLSLSPGTIAAGSPTESW